MKLYTRESTGSHMERSLSGLLIKNHFCDKSNTFVVIKGIITDTGGNVLVQRSICFSFKQVTAVTVNDQITEIKQL